MLTLLCFALTMSHPAPLADEVWIGNYKTSAGTFIPHMVGTTQELTLRADGTCRILTRNHHFLGGAVVEVTRDGTYLKEGSLVTFELVKDGKTIKSVAELQAAMMIFDGLQAPFNFSSPCVFTPAKDEAKFDGKYRLTLYDKATQQFVSFPKTLTIADESYSLTSDRTPNEAAERGTVSTRKLLGGKMALSFKSDSPKAILNAKTWTDLYHGEVWTVPQPLSVEFPEFAKDAAGFDLILLEKVKPPLLPK